MAFGRNSFEQYLEPCNAVPTADPFEEAHVFRRAEVKRIDEGRPLSDIDWVPPHVVEMGMPPAHMQLLPWLRKGARATADSIRDQAHNSVGSPFDVEDLPDDTVCTVRGNKLSLYDLYPLATPGYRVIPTVIHVLLNELRVDPRGSLFFLPSDLMGHSTWQSLMEEYGLDPAKIEEATRVVLPYCRDRHWYLVVLVPATRIYHYYTCNPDDARDMYCKAALGKLLHDSSSWLGSDRPWVEETVACAAQDADASGVSICATAYALAKNLDPHDDVPPGQDVILRRYFLHLLSTHGDAEDGQGDNDNDDDNNDGAPADDRVKYRLTEAQKRQADDLVKKLSKVPKRK